VFRFGAVEVILPPVRRSLPQLGEKKEGLGRPTIMDRAMAARYGVPYVHLAAFAIDVDRARDALDDDEVGTRSDLPMGWEVFLTERYLATRVDAREDPLKTMIEDAVLGVFDLPPSDDAVFGSQLPFAVWHCIERGLYPSELGSVFGAWKTKPKELGRDLDRLMEKADENTRRFAKRCLEVSLDPPMAPPSLEALAALAAEP
jgi:hypothetical protein